MADKNFLTGVFLYSSTKFEFEEAPARKIRHEKCCGIEEKNEISAELIKAMYEERKQLNLQRIALQNSPRCAKCSKMATSQAGCCELHVYCELCRQDPEIYGISGVFSCPKEIIMKKTEVIKSKVINDSNKTYPYFSRSRTTPYAFDESVGCRERRRSNFKQRDQNGRERNLRRCSKK